MTHHVTFPGTQLAALTGNTPLAESLTGKVIEGMEFVVRGLMVNMVYYGDALTFRSHPKYEEARVGRLLMSLSTLAYASALNWVVAYGGYRKKSLSLDGAFTGFTVGMLHACAGWSPIWLLFLFFVSSSIATKRGQKRKKKLEEDFREGGQRNWVQVLCNGGPQALCCALYLYKYGTAELAIDFTDNFTPSSLILAVMGGYACANGDTWSSEFGVLSKVDPILITRLKRVPKGTNGGISMQGTVASVLGGTLVGFGLFLSNYLATGTLWYRTIALGDAYDPDRFAVRSYASIFSVKHICGINFLSNHTVNLVSVLLATALTGLYAHHFYEL